ncbi:hypothetical protein Lal_00035450 [Lupinus albus]|nr:hypothetical protein Lal_00035450 [Lupinus albus]
MFRIYGDWERSYKVACILSASVTSFNRKYHSSLWVHPKASSHEKIGISNFRHLSWYSRSPQTPLHSSWELAYLGLAMRSANASSNLFVLASYNSSRIRCSSLSRHIYSLSCTQSSKFLAMLLIGTMRKNRAEVFPHGTRSVR